MGKAAIPLSKVTCAVPARLASSRFPGKLLQSLGGIPVVLHTLERARLAQCFADIVCLTDNDDIFNLAIKNGFRAVKTGKAFNGTDRIAKNLEAIETDLVVNLQGDEPLFPLEALRTLCRETEVHPEWAHTIVHATPPKVDDLRNPNRVKVKLSPQDFVIDFFRDKISPVPGRTELHVGAYGYHKDYLKKYAKTPMSRQEYELNIELLRDFNIAPVKAHACPYNGQAIDTPEDLERARILLTHLPAFPMAIPHLPNA